MMQVTEKGTEKELYMNTMEVIVSKSELTLKTF